MKVLVVDDSRAMRGIIARTLAGLDQMASAQILQAGGGEEALACMREHPLDLILCDWNMPGMSGLDLLDTLNAAGSTIPFGFVTAEATPEFHEVARAAGASFVVTKPFSADTLARAIDGGW